MFKNQQTYFSKPNIPDDVIQKSLVKMNKPKPKKQIKKSKKVSKPAKSLKQQNIDKLMKTYGKNNNMISLLIYLLKHKDQNKRQYKTKSTYRSGYRKGNNYTTKGQLQKERQKESKLQEGKKVHSQISQKIAEANKSKLQGDTRKEQELLKQALKISEDYLTTEDYENYGKFLTPEERKNPQLIARLKKATEEAIVRADEERKKLLKDKQNAGRKQAEAVKEQEMIDYISGLLFTERKTQPQLQRIFDEFKQQGKSPPNAYSKSKFNKLLKEKYDTDLKQLIELEDKEKEKLQKEAKLKADIKQFFKDKVYSEVPVKAEIKRIRKEYQDQFGESLTKDEILKLIKIQSEPPAEPQPKPAKRGRKTKKDKIDEAVDAITGAGGNDIKGINAQLQALEKYVIKEDYTRLEKLRKKTHISETEQKELDGIEKMIAETNERKELLKSKKVILKDYIERGLIPENIDESFLPDVLDLTNDDYEAELLNLNAELQETDTDEEQDDSD